MINNLKEQAARLAAELIEAARLKPGNVLVVGCSTSEVLGHKIGSCSSEDTGRAIFEGICESAKKYQVFLAAQCCEHLNRAIIIEETASKLLGLEPVNVIPQPKAGGSFAAAAYKGFRQPVAAEEIQADAGIDIGGTLIGMHLKRVAVPVRLSTQTLGNAGVICARVRPKYIGGERAHYDIRLS